MNYANAEFEFIILGEATVVHDAINQSDNTDSKVLLVNVKTNVLAYQTWNLKTLTLNQGRRKRVYITIGQFIDIMNSNPDYNPRTILTFDNNDINIFTITKIFSGKKKQDGNMDVYLMIDVLKGNNVSFAGTKTVRLNLSSIPIYMINNGVENIPLIDKKYNFGAISDVQIDSPLFNYILRETADVTIKNGVINLTIYNSCKLFKYQEWSASTIDLNKDKKTDFDSAKWLPTARKAVEAGRYPKPPPRHGFPQMPMPSREEKPAPRPTAETLRYLSSFNSLRQSADGESLLVKKMSRSPSLS